MLSFDVEVLLIRGEKLLKFASLGATVACSWFSFGLCLLSAIQMEGMIFSMSHDPSFCSRICLVYLQFLAGCCYVLVRPSFASLSV